MQVHPYGMWGFPPSWVFLDLCVNSRELCIMLCSVGSVHSCTCVGICLYAHMISGRMFMCMHNGNFIFVVTQTKIVKRNSQSGALLIKCSPCVSFHGLVIHWFRFDSSWLDCSLLVEKRSALDTSSRKYFKGGFTGSPGGLWPQRVMFSYRSLSLKSVNGSVHAEDSQADGWGEIME